MLTAGENIIRLPERNDVAYTVLLYLYVKVELYQAKTKSLLAHLSNKTNLTCNLINTFYHVINNSKLKQTVIRDTF